MFWKYSYCILFALLTEYMGFISWKIFYFPQYAKKKKCFHIRTFAHRPFCLVFLHLFCFAAFTDQIMNVSKSLPIATETHREDFSHIFNHKRLLVKRCSCLKKRIILQPSQTRLWLRTFWNPLYTFYWVSEHWVATDQHTSFVMGTWTSWNVWHQKSCSPCPALTLTLPVCWLIWISVPTWVLTNLNFRPYLGAD